MQRISYHHSVNPSTRRFLNFFSASATWCHAPATWFHACMQLHACNLDLATRACGRACMQSRSRKMHGRACIQPFVYVGSHACKSNMSTWLKVRLTRSIYTWHLHACESLRYFLMHFFEFSTRRHRSLLIASARLDF
jgi:hypothetical protein